MKQSTILCLLVLAFAVFVGCSDGPQTAPKTTRADSLAIVKIDSAQNARIFALEQRLDSVINESAYEKYRLDSCFKEQRVAEWYLRKDYAQVMSKLDSVAKKEPRLRTICKAIGDLAGSLTGINSIGKAFR